MLKCLFRPRFAGAAMALLLMMSWASDSRAGDIETARRNLATAREDLKDQKWNDIEKDMRSVEDFLEGVPDAEKAPVLKDLADLRQQADAGLKAFKAKAIVDTATRDIDSAASDVTSSPQGAAERLKKASDLLNSDDAKKYVDADTSKKLIGRIAGLQQMADTRIKKAAMDRLAPILKDLEDQVAADPFKGKPENEVYQAAQQLNSLKSRIRGILESLPKDDADVKAINDKLAAIDKKIDMAAGSSEKTDAVAKVSGYWKNTQEYFAGWDKETEMPTWARYTHEGSEAMSQLLMPKTAEAVTRASRWLDESQVKDAQAKYGDDPALNAIITEAKKTLDTASGKLSKAFNGLLDEAEKLPPQTDETARRKLHILSTSAENWFAGTPLKDANAARAKKLYDKWQGAIAGAAQAGEDLYKKMAADATANWPKIEASTNAADGFNPADAAQWKGKTIRLKGVFNRAMWDYKPDYDFAIKINGMVVAGRYAPNVKAAFEEAQTKTAKEIDDHVPWDVIGIVEGPGKIQEQASADVKVKGSGETVGTVEGYRTVDCAVLRIIALHAGPVAVGPGGSMAASGGSAPSAATAAPVVVGGGWGMRILWVLLTLAAAAVAYIKAQPTAIASVSGGPASSITRGDNLAYAGLVFAALGIVWLLWSRIIHDLFPALAMTAAGLYAAVDLLKAKGLLSDANYAKIKPLGMPIAMAAAGLAVLHLLIGGWMFF